MEEKQVIAIYDIRGIQNYIFKTNKVKEIVGASKIVRQLMIKEFEQAVYKQIATKKIEKKQVVLNWEEVDNYSFDCHQDIQIEVLYYGGGNLVVLFRREKLCQEVSMEMAKSIIKNAYGLSLVYAYVEKTEHYQEDWKNLKERLSTIKSVTPPNQPAGIVPIVQYDSTTLSPLSKEVNHTKVTYEAYYKMMKYNDKNEEENDSMLEFDRMRTSEGEGLIAIVHIDGNSMGMNIRNILSHSTTYEEAVYQMRSISKNIHEAFEIKAIEDVKNKLPEICKKHGISYTKKFPFRPLIQAGDDITFVCNERIALDLVMEFIHSIRTGYMYQEKYPFSACAGIAIIHSHYPFYKGYKMAEECCKSAKSRAKKEGMIDGQIANFVDFEYDNSTREVSLEKSRELSYRNLDDYSLLKRPYGIYNDLEKEKLTEEQQQFSIDDFFKNLQLFSSISHNVAKSFRDAYYDAKSEIDIAFKQHAIKTGTNYDSSFVKIGGEMVANYYDAIEFLDIFRIQEEGGKKHEESN